MAERLLDEIVEAGWAKALAAVSGRISAMGDFLRAEVAAGLRYLPAGDRVLRYLPAGDRVLRAFQQPFDDGLGFL